MGTGPKGGAIQIMMRKMRTTSPFTRRLHRMCIPMLDVRCHTPKQLPG